MKTQIISIAFILVSTGISAQTFSDTPFKDATVITIKTTNTDSLNIKQFCDRLLDFGIFIKNQNDANNTIETELINPRTKGWKSQVYLYRIRFKNGDIVIRSYWTTGGNSIVYDGAPVESSLNQWKYKSSNLVIQNVIYQETLEVIKDYCNCKILYSN